MLERDGRGDEIFVRGDVYEFRNRGNFAGHRVVKSLVFGANGDIRAGSAPAPFNAADDQPGGLITNDQYPPRGDNFSDQPAARQGDLPMILWEGELGEQDEVLIVPSIWEWDGTETSRAETAWDAQLDRNVPPLRLGGLRMIGANTPTFPNGGVVSRDIVDPIYVYDDGNRPIGAMPRIAEFNTARMPVNAIVLSLETAERTAGQALMFTARNFAEDGTVTRSVEYVGPPGGLEVSMADPPQLEGRYALYLRLEKVN